MRNVETGGDLDFDSCTFSGVTTMTNIVCGGSFLMDASEFRSKATLNGLKIAGSLYAYDAEFFGDTSFQSAVVVGEARFARTVFDGAVSFNRAHFQDEQQFYNAVFNGPASFNTTRFEGPCFFNDATFHGGENERRQVDFRNARWEVAANFEKAVFKESYPVLSGASFEESASFTAEDAYWPDTFQGEDPNGNFRQDALDAYRNECRATMAALRHLMTTQGRPDDAHFFFRREMTFAGMNDPWGNGLLYRLFGWISDYGGSIARPSWGLLWVFIAPLGVYLAALGTTDFATFGQSLGLSFASIFKFLGFQRTYFGVSFMQNAHIIVQVLTAAQSVLAFILLFFLGLGLRTRFRLR